MCLSLEDVALPIYVIQNDFKLNGILWVENASNILLEMVFFVKYTMPYFKEYGFICREII